MATARELANIDLGQCRAAMGHRCIANEKERPVDDLGISAYERRSLRRITRRPVSARDCGQHFDDAIAAIHGLLPFTQCVVLHERVLQAHTVAFVYRQGRGLTKRTGSTHRGDQPLRIRHYLQAFSRFGTFENAFFWFQRQPAQWPDRGVADALWHAKLTEGIAGGVNVYGSQQQRCATLVQLQYGHEQFAAKHLVFANLIASYLHGYFEQGEEAANEAPGSAHWVCSPGRMH
jgi:hypothetical protein